MVIYAKGKNIPTYGFSNLFTQGEHFADVIYFVVDRFYCGKDLTQCTFAIRGVTEENWEVDELLVQEEVLNDKIKLKWTVVDGFTHNAGKLTLEIRASKTVDESNYTIIKYNMAPVYVNPTPAGRNGPLPETAEQAVSAINEATGIGLETIRQEIADFDLSPYEEQLAAATAADLVLLQNKMDEFNLEEVEARLDQMEEDTATYLARPEVVALTRAQYEAITPKSNSLYVIIRGNDT